MATALDSPSKSWWSKAKSSSAQASTSEKLKSKPSKALGSLFGLKSKKPIPLLSIQDPPFPIQSKPLEARPPLSFTNRPPSKSVSSTRSRTDSLEPRTPSDFQHHHHVARQSLLTLSDTDPFASGRGVSVVASPSLPSDPTRLSAYSAASSNEQAHRKNADNPPVQRTSYASSSSQSHNHSNGLDSPLPLSPVLPSAATISSQGKLITKRSDSALNRKGPGGPPLRLQTFSTTSATGSSKMSARPATRPRGLTDISSTQKSGFFVDSPSTAVAYQDDSHQSSSRPSSRRPSNASSSRPPLTSPRVVIRQASLQHITRPAPPPTLQLPAPPQSPDAIGPPPLARRLHSNSTASSSLSFASSTLSKDMIPTPTLVSPVRQRQISEHSSYTSHSNGPDREPPEGRGKPSPAPLSPPMTLKKALSHQSLPKRGHFSSIASSDAPNIPPSHDVEKSSHHKPRGFPHPRIPMPTLPLKHGNFSASTLNDSASPEQKRASTSSGRKRLFSGSSLRRPSTSQSVMARDEDAQSVFSMKSDQDLYINTSFFKPWISTLPSHPSFWDEAVGEAGSSPVRGPADTSTLAPIPMSPTLGKLDLTRDAPPISFTSPTLTAGSRQRGFSIRSSSTVASTECDSESILSGLSPRSQASEQRDRFQRSNTITTPRGFSRNKLDTPEHHVVGRPRTATSSSTGSRNTDRPSTQPSPNSETKYTDVAFERSFFKSSALPPPLMTSLPPPPRPRGRATLITKVEDPPPKPTVIALSPPPPPRRPHQKISFEKILHRRSLMKKPSFLDIDDDDDDDDDDEGLIMDDESVQLFEDPRDRVFGVRGKGQRSGVLNAKPPPVNESFLDFARESFDTVRSN